MTDIYKAPSADLEKPIEPIKGGSIETALQGQYDVKAIDLIKQAWGMKKGFIMPFVLAAIVYLIISTAFSFITEFLGLGAQNANQFVVSSLGILTYLASILFITPLLAGLIMMSIKHAAGGQAQVGDLFNYYHKIWPLFLTYIIMTILILIGFVLLVLPGIYLMISYVYAIPLVAEKNLSPWEALETSRKAVTKKWWSVFGFCILLWLFMMLGFLAILIGAIWTIPVATLAFGILYCNMFGVEENTLR